MRLHLVAATAALALCGCSASHNAGSSPGGGPCASLVGQPVGAEIDADSTYGGALATAPACADRGVSVSGQYGCYDAAGNPHGDWFYVTMGDTTIYGVPGGKWLGMPADRFNVDARANVGC